MKGILSKIFVPKIIDIMVILAILTILTTPYLLNKGVPFYYKSDFSADNTYIINRAKEVSKGWLFSGWNESSSRPEFNLLPIFFIQFVILLKVFISNIWTVWKLIQILQLFLAGISFYLLARFYSKSRISSILSSLVYSTSPFFFGRLAIHPGSISWMYALTPFVFLTIETILCMKKVKIKYYLLLGALIGITCFTHFYFVYINGIFYILFIILKFSLNKYSINKKYFFGFIFAFITSIFFFSFLVFPTFFEKFPQYSVGNYFSSDLLSRKVEGNTGVWSEQNIYKIFAQDDYEMVLHAKSVGYEREVSIFKNILFIYTLPLIFSIYFMIKNTTKNVNSLIFIFLFLLSVALSNGVYFPIMNLYVIFAKFLPGFDFLRATSRFELHTALFTSLVFGLQLTQLFSSKYFMKARKYVKYCIIFSLFCIFCILAYTNGYLGPSFLLKNRVTLNNFNIVQEYFSKIDQSKYRVVDLTIAPGWFDQTLNNGLNGFHFGQQMIKVYANSSSLSSLLSAHNIKYIIYSQLSSNEYISGEINTIENNLMNNGNWKKNVLLNSKSTSQLNINKYQKEMNIDILENIEPLAKFYTSLNSRVGDADNSKFHLSQSTATSSPQIDFKQTGASTYYIHIKNATTPFYLIQTESFFPGWEAKFDNVKIKSIPNDIKTLNIYFINKVGNFNIEINYENTIIRSVSNIISFMLFLILIVSWILNI